MPASELFDWSDSVLPDYLSPLADASYEEVLGFQKRRIIRRPLRLTTRIFGSDLPTIKKIAGKLMPEVPPATRMEISARALGFRTAAALQARFKMSPAAPRVVSTRLDSRADDLSGCELLQSLPDAVRQKAVTLGDAIIIQLLRTRFRISKGARNPVRNISDSVLVQLGELAGGAIFARWVIAEARFDTFATAPVSIDEADLSEALLAAGVPPSRPSNEALSGALILAMDLGLSVRKIVALSVDDVIRGEIPVGPHDHASLGKKPAGYIEDLLQLPARSRPAPALCRSFLHGRTPFDQELADEEPCDPEELDAMVFAATGARCLGLAPVTLRDASIATHLLLCHVLGWSVTGAARRLSVDPSLFRKAVNAIGGKYRDRDAEQSAAVRLMVSTETAARNADEIGAIRQAKMSAIDAMMDIVDHAHSAPSNSVPDLAPNTHSKSLAPEVPPTTNSSRANAMTDIGKKEAKSLQDHILSFFAEHSWEMPFKPSLLARCLNPLNVKAREVIEASWIQGDISADGSLFNLDWTLTYPTSFSRSFIELGGFALDVYADGSVCALTDLTPLDPISTGTTDLDDRTAREEASRHGHMHPLGVQCIPFPLTIRSSVLSVSGERLPLGRARIVDLLCAPNPLVASAGSCSDSSGSDSLVADMRLQLQREISAIRAYAEARPLGVPAVTHLTASRHFRDDQKVSLPWWEPLGGYRYAGFTGHDMRLRWRDSTDPSNAHFSYDPYTECERLWVQEAIDIATAIALADAELTISDVRFAAAAPNLATGHPGGCVFFLDPMRMVVSEVRDPDLPTRVERAKLVIRECMTPILVRLTKPGFIYSVHHGVLPLKLAMARDVQIEADPRILRRKLNAHCSKYPAEGHA